MRIVGDYHTCSTECRLAYWFLVPAVFCHVIGYRGLLADCTGLTDEMWRLLNALLTSSHD